MYEEEPTVDERIDFLRRVKKARDQDLADVIEHPERFKLPDWQIEIVKDQRRRRLQERLERAAERLAETISRHEMDEDEQECLENRIREKWQRQLAEREEIENKLNQTTPKTKTQKEDITMAANKTTEAANETAATPKFDTKAIIGFKVAELMTKAMDKGDGLPLTKMTVMQSLAEGKGLNVNEIVKAKYTENFMKELDANKDIPLGKLIAFQTLQENGAMDINAICQAKFVEKLFNDLDEPTETEQKK